MKTHLCKKKPTGGRFPVLRVLLAAVLMLLIARTVRSETDFNASYWYDKAYEEKDFDLKIKYYRKSLEKEPDNPDIYNNLGVVYKKKGLYEQSLGYFKKALSIPRYQTPEYAYLNMALVYRLQKNYPQAIRSYKKAIQVNPNFPKAYNDLGMTYKEMGDFDNALKYFKLALEVDPGFLAANFNIKNLWKVSAGKSTREIELKKKYDLGLELMEKGRIQDAIDTFEWIHKLDREYLDVHENLKKAKKLLLFDDLFRTALWPAEAGEWDDAVVKFEGSLKYAMEKDQELLVRRIVDSLNRIKEEREKTRRLARYYQEGKKHHQKKEWLQAISYFTKVIMEDPSYLNVEELNKQVQINYYLDEAALKIRSGRWEEARVLLNNSRMTDAENSRLKELKVKLHAGIEQENISFYLNQVRESMFFKDYDSALINLNEVLTLDDKNAEAISIKNQIKDIKTAFKERKNEQPAADYLKLLSGIKPDRLKKIGILAAAALVLYILIFKIIRPGKVWIRLMRLREMDGNREIYEDQLAADPNRIELYPALALIYQELGQTDKLDSLCEFCQSKAADEKADVFFQVQWAMCLADVYKELGQNEKAKDKYEDLFKKYPHLVEVLDSMILFYRRLSEEAKSKPDKLRLEELLLAKVEFADHETEKRSVVIERKGSGGSIPKLSGKEVSEEETRKALQECFGKEKRTGSLKKITLSPPESEEAARKLLADVVGEKGERPAGDDQPVLELPEPAGKVEIEMDADPAPEEIRLSETELRNIEEENKRILKDFLGRK